MSREEPKEKTNYNNKEIMKISKKIKSTMSLAALAGLALTTSTQAATIVGVTIEDVSSELTGAPHDRQAIYSINGTGYTAGVQSTHSDGAEGVHWLNNGTFQAPNDTIPAHITYDLEGNYDLSSFTVWNYNESGFASRGANGVTVSVASSEGGSFTALAGITTFAQAPGNDTTNFGETFDLTSLVAAGNVRLLRIDITSNHGATLDLVGLSEIRFDGTLVPEPSTTALLGDRKSVV